MTQDIAIKVENISKRYEIGESSNFVTLRDKLIELPRRIFQGPKKTKTFWALKNVSFEIKKGEVVGVIGRNGAGKSTLLKILARITEPTSGKVTMYGRVASMLEVGTGFNPELTGRENIYLNGAIIGMKKSEIAAKFNDIVEFSGVGKFLDTPVKHYSSGMYVRLAFAVTAHLDADILIIDEVLAVGDSQFQTKSLKKMRELASSGRTVIFVSHNMTAVTELCGKAVFLQDGRLTDYGKTSEIITKYFELISEWSDGKSTSSTTSKLKITNVLIEGESKSGYINFQDDFEILITVDSANKATGVIAASIMDVYHKVITTFHTVELGTYGAGILPPDMPIKKGKSIYKLSIKNLCLRPGKYYLETSILNRKSSKVFYTYNKISFVILAIGERRVFDERQAGYVFPQSVTWEVI